MSAAEEFDPNVLTREERIAALKAARGAHRAAFEKARRRRQAAELAAFFAKDDEDTNADESHEMGEAMEFEVEGDE